MDEHSNWWRANEAHTVAVRIDDLIRIGVFVGLDVAERVYLSLKDEPMTAHGDHIDWLDIRREIVRRLTHEC